eukprot:TRINITY_DN4909_c0_g1_i6.p1 TRINITY_DN4909_c0_g1~~TRINITY_DN4909_c0_g1_i6.p1  ORF type:complete len:353 (+),score=47.22 TRINITY_DN4909_c0_g1_i6:91-1059(+)
MAAADNNADVILEAALAQTAAGAQGQQCGPTDLIVKGVGSMQPLPDKVTDALAGHIEALGRPQELEEFVCHVCKDHAFGSPVSTTCDAGHLFHEECIERWLQDKTSCPVCRQELPTEVRCDLPLRQAAAPHRRGVPEHGLRLRQPGLRRVRLPPAHHGAHPELPPHPRPLVHKGSACPQRRVDCGRCRAKMTACQEEDHKQSCSGTAQVSDIAALKELALLQNRQLAQQVTKLQGEQDAIRKLVETTFALAASRWLPSASTYSPTPARTCLGGTRCSPRATTAAPSGAPAAAASSPFPTSSTGASPPRSSSWRTTRPSSASP